MNFVEAKQKANSREREREEEEEEEKTSSLPVTNVTHTKDRC